jgi:hypothetical protein
MTDLVWCGRLALQLRIAPPSRSDLDAISARLLSADDEAIEILALSVRRLDGQRCMTAAGWRRLKKADPHAFAEVLRAVRREVLNKAVLTNFSGFVEPPPPSTSRTKRPR